MLNELKFYLNTLSSSGVITNPDNISNRQMLLNSDIIKRFFYLGKASSFMSEENTVGLIFGNYLNYAFLYSLYQ